MSDMCKVTSDRSGERRLKGGPESSPISRVTCHGFTLLELLVVIAIMGILAGLAVPALKNLGKSSASVSASRQLLDDVGRARQLAMARRANVFMVFVPTNFWLINGFNLAGMTPAQQSIASNLVPLELTGYTFIAYGAVGDQPGRHQWHYLASWQSLPAGSFIPPQKFWPPQAGHFNIPAWTNDMVAYGVPIDNWRSPTNQIYPFVAAQVPFPTEDSTNFIYLPCVEFDSFGKLISESPDNGNSYHHAYIPLAQGSVSYPLDINSKAPIIPPAANSVMPGDITENPAGNSGIENNNVSYTVVDVDPLTGRPTQEFHKLP